MAPSMQSSCTRSPASSPLSATPLCVGQWAPRHWPRWSTCTRPRAGTAASWAATRPAVRRWREGAWRSSGQRRPGSGRRRSRRRAPRRPWSAPSRPRPSRATRRWRSAWPPAAGPPGARRRGGSPAPTSPCCTSRTSPRWPCASAAPWTRPGRRPDFSRRRAHSPDGATAAVYPMWGVPCMEAGCKPTLICPEACPAREFEAPAMHLYASEQRPPTPDAETMAPGHRDIRSNPRV
mmetsp:Transcript_50700/g.151722  ORF Transcript_50700/g.151722 Transcript_50700/m.151722 type:complete len:235 (-) Transcript_50700:25-729(-)